jgi:ring-opening amidohydrolase-like protein
MSCGIRAAPAPRPASNWLAKAEAAHSGVIRGARHTMLDDSDIQASRHARALVGGVLAALAGTTLLFVSGGAEHQGPDGDGPVAVIARRGGEMSETLSQGRDFAPAGGQILTKQ